MNRGSRHDLTQGGDGRLETVLPHDGVFYVTSDVACLRILFVNVYLLGVPGSSEWILVDAGLPGSARRIIRTAECRFGRGVPPRAIVLTHGHFDHVGALRELVERWKCPVFAHPAELPFLQGDREYPPPEPLVGGLIGLSSILMPRKPADLPAPIAALENKGALSIAPDWRWIATPGHAEGHVSLFREKDGVLVAGDAVTTVRQESALAVFLQRPELGGPPAYFTPDWKAARESVHALARLEPRTIASGHGVPIKGRTARQALHELASRFDALALPVRSRYLTPAAVRRDEKRSDYSLRPLARKGETNPPLSPR